MPKATVWLNDEWLAINCLTLKEAWETGMGREGGMIFRHLLHISVHVYVCVFIYILLR